MVIKIVESLEFEYHRQTISIFSPVIWQQSTPCAPCQTIHSRTSCF